MNLKTLYREERAKGWPARTAINNARTLIAWHALEATGAVRLRVEPDCDPYDASYVDTWDDVPSTQRERIKTEILNRADDEGVWGIVGEYRTPDGDWEHADSCWGFIGNDWRDSGYDTDTMSATIDAAREALALAEFADRPA